MTALRVFAGIREAQGITKRSAAIRLGVSERHLERVERGRLPLSPDLAAGMAREYSCTLSDILRHPSRRGAGDETQNRRV